MSDLREIYQEVILDHNRQPRNRGILEHPTHEAEGYNPLCGDQIHLTIEVADGKIANIAFEGHGCAISTASSSLMTEYLKGIAVKEAEALFEAFHCRLMDEPCAEEIRDKDLGKLEALQGVKEFPIRVKCATLPWHTMIAALHQAAEPVTTE